MEQVFLQRVRVEDLNSSLGWISATQDSASLHGSWDDLESPTAAVLFRLCRFAEVEASFATNGRVRREVSQDEEAPPAA